MNLKRLSAHASVLALGTLVPATTLALTTSQGVNPFGTATNQITDVGNAAGINSGSTNVYQIAGNLINVVLGFLGIILLGYFLYAGFLWMTSGGSDDKAEEARTMIKNAVIGLIIIVSAFAISNFVLGSLVNVTGTRP